MIHTSKYESYSKMYEKKNVFLRIILHKYDSYKMNHMKYESYFKYETKVGLIHSSQKKPFFFEKSRKKSEFTTAF